MIYDPGKALFFLLCLFVPSFSIAQQFNFAQSERIESLKSNAEEINPILLNDTLFFSRIYDPKNSGGELDVDIWMSVQEMKDIWSSAVKVEGLNDENYNELIGVNRDKLTYYLRNSGSYKSGILFSRKTSNGFSEPELIPIKGLSQNGFTGFYMHPDYQILLISMEGKDSFGKEDIYVSTRDKMGRWSKPINLGSTINTSGFEISPFLSSDGLTLYFSSNGHDGFGDSDIFMSQRKYGVWDVWSKPINLGENINSSAFDADLFIDSDSTVIFLSNRESTNSELYHSKLLPGKQTNQNQIDSLLAEAENLLSEIKSDVDPKINYITFTEDSENLSAQNKDLLDFWIDSMISKGVSKGLNLTYDDSAIDGYEDKLLFSKRLNNIFNYLISNGLVESQLNIDRLGSNLGLSEGLIKNTVVIRIKK